MAVEEQYHQYRDRERAQSFGAAAEDYDRHRPGFPDAVVDHLASLAAGPVLDAGCGTGRLGRALAGRGLTVLGVEPDDRMAAVARAHGLTVETATFEDWPDGGRRVGLLTFGQSWHWIEPVRGTARAAGVLRSGGVLARLWNHFVLDEHVLSRLDAVYREHAPTAHAHGRLADDTGFRDHVAESPEFDGVRTVVHHGERTFGTADWLAMTATFSDHHRLGPERLGALQDAVRATIDELGGTLHATSCTHTLVSRRR